MAFSSPNNFPNRLPVKYGSNPLAPSMQYNFLSGNLDPSLTFTRASAASYYNSSGLLSSATTNTPRFDYNPTTLALNGLLMEQASTNLVLHSNAFTTTPWTNYNSTVTASAAVGPDGVSGSATAVAPTGQYGNINQIVAISASTAYTVSIWVKWFSGNTNLTLQFNDGTNYYSQAITITSTWTRYTVSFTTVSGATSGVLSIQDSNGSNFGVFYVFGAQMETNSNATSYISTTTTTATRSADFLSTTSIPWFNAAGGSMVVTALKSAYSGTYSSDAQIDTGSVTNSVSLRGNNSANSYIFNNVYSGSTTSTTKSSAFTYGTPYIAGIAWSATAAIAAINAVSPGGFTANTPACTTLRFSDTTISGNYAINGWLQRFQAWNYELSSTQLTAIT